MNRYRILDYIRRTSIVKNRDYYLRIIRDPNIHEKAMALQKEKLVSFLKRLKRNEYYRIYLKNISDSDIEIHPYEVLRSIPLTDKSTLTKHFTQVRNTDYPGESCYTGGSTGSPFHFFAGKSELSSLIGFTMFLWTFLGGYDWDDSTIVVGGVSIGDKRSIKKRILHFLQRRKYISGGNITSDNCKRLARLINKAPRPVYLYGYPSSICQYIQLFQELHISINKKNVIKVITTSEMLSDERKALIGGFFEKDVINLYGARDGGVSAGSTDNRTFIYNGIDCVAETVSINGVNEIVLTNLDSDAFPFVRYRTGDIADVSLRAEGYPFIIQNLQGRTRDFIHIGPTEKLHGSQINKVFKDTSVIEYQVFQHKDYHCDIRIMTSSVMSDDELELLSTRLKRVMADVPFDIIIVEGIERGKNNKLRNIISEVSS